MGSAKSRANDYMRSRLAKEASDEVSSSDSEVSSRWLRVGRRFQKEQQKNYILKLERMMIAEVQSHKQANDALQ